MPDVAFSATGLQGNAVSYLCPTPAAARGGPLTVTDANGDNLIGCPDGPGTPSCEFSVTDEPVFLGTPFPKAEFTFAPSLSIGFARFAAHDDAPAAQAARAWDLDALAATYRSWQRFAADLVASVDHRPDPVGGLPGLLRRVDQERQCDGHPGDLPQGRGRPGPVAQERPGAGIGGPGPPACSSPGWTPR